MSCLQQLARGVVLPQREAVTLVEQLSTFTTLFFLYLYTLHDTEFYREVKGEPPEVQCTHSVTSGKGACCTHSGRGS